MLRHGLQPLDVGGEGDCLFKSISHQLYGDSKHHAEIRATAMRFLSDNPDRFIVDITNIGSYCSYHKRPIRRFVPKCWHSTDGCR